MDGVLLALENELLLPLRSLNEGRQWMYQTLSKAPLPPPDDDHGGGGHGRSLFNHSNSGRQRSIGWCRRSRKVPLALAPEW